MIVSTRTSVYSCLELSDRKKMHTFSGLYAIKNKIILNSKLKNLHDSHHNSKIHTCNTHMLE